MMIAHVNEQTTVATQREMIDDLIKKDKYT